MNQWIKDLDNITLVIMFTVISFFTCELFANVCKLREKTKVKGITTRVIIDNRRPLKDGTYPLKLRFTCNRKSKYIGLNTSMTELDFWRISSDQSLRGKLKDARLRLKHVESRAASIAAQMEDCDFEHFKAAFLDRPLRSDRRYMDHWFEEKERQLSNPNTKDIYRNTYKSIEQFKGRKVMVEDITPAWLENYRQWMLSQGKSVNTTAMYLRNIRHIYLNVIDAGLASMDNYPFGRRRFKIPSSRNVKKSLSFEQVYQVFQYPAEERYGVESWETFSRDMWRFFYLVNGMNPVDAAGLKYSSIRGDLVSFYRTKTMGKTKHVRPVSSVMHAEALEVINKWGQKPRTPETYIFAVLKPGMDAEKQRSSVKNWTKQINKYLKRIGEDLELPIKLTTMTARHSHANVLMNSGASREFIQRSLGHSSAQTTENYLKDFELSNQRKYLSALTNWS